MAKRYVYYIDENDDFNQIEIEFKWYSGFSKLQKQKSIKDLHKNIKDRFDCDINDILEISTKSESSLGVSLSAFNLKVELFGETKTVENFFQSSKVFERGGPYRDLREVSPLEAKKDKRLRESGSLKYFSLFNQKWDIEPKSLFYDWIYINALHQNRSLILELNKHKYFTDIEFNPKKQFACQAKSASIYLSLYKKNKIEIVISNKNLYIETMELMSNNVKSFQQVSLFDV